MSFLLFFVSLIGFSTEFTECTPVIDGLIDDECWVQCEPYEGEFTAFRPTADIPMTQSTDVRVAYDSENLYVSAFMYDPDPSRINHQLGARDNDFPVDKFYIYLDTFNDDSNCFIFVVTVDGIQIDYKYTEVNGQDRDWDAVWSSEVAMSDSGWTAEIAIPFSVLRYSSAEEQVWGVNFGRTISYTNEAGYLCRMKELGGYDVSKFADLSGLINLPEGSGIEIRPFLAGRLQTATGDGFFSEPWGSAGVDLKIPLSMQTVVDVTLNPDFGQIESDANEGNISHWAPWLREKRPFFMEGTDIFDMPFNMFYSRSIGAVAWNGDLIPILGGVKITGTSGKFRYGALEVLTGRVWDDTTLVEPMKTYTVGSILEEFSPGNWIKFSGTSTDTPDQEDEEYSFNRSAAFAGMMTIKQYFEFKGKLGLTWNRFEENSENAAMRMDAGYFRDRFSFNFRYEQTQEDFLPTALGYFSGNGNTSYSFYSEASHRFDSDYLESGWIGVNGWIHRDSEDRNSGTGINTWFGLSNMQRYDVNFWTTVSDRWFDRYEGPEGRWYDGGFSGGLSFSSDYRKPVAGWVSANRNNYLDSWMRSFSGGLMVKPTPAILLEADGRYRIQEPATMYNWSQEEWESTSTDWQTVSISVSYMLNQQMQIKLNSQISRFERDWATENDSYISNNIWANLLYSWEYAPGSWFHFLIGEVGEEDEDPEFTVYAKLTRFI